MPADQPGPQGSFDPQKVADGPEKVLFHGSRFRIHEACATLPDGSPIAKQIIRHPGAVVIVPLLDDQRVVMIRNYRYSVARTLLELPAGTREAGEPPAETAARELAEETGYHAGQLEFVQSFFAAPGICDEELFLFFARDLRQAAPHRELGEQIENQILSWHEIAEKIDAGQIQDAKTLVGLMHGLRRRQGQGS